MSILAIPSALRNLQKQQKKLAGRYGDRYRQHPDGIAIIERPTALAWAAAFRTLNTQGARP